MNHCFSLKIDPILGTGRVLLNNGALFAQSQLQVCTTQNFLEWYRDLPNLMYAEINDRYRLEATCNAIQYEMLRAVFSGIGECCSMAHTPVRLRYGVQQRLTWLGEAASRLKVTLPDIPRCAIRGCGGPDAQSVIRALPGFYQKYCVTGQAQVNIWLADPANLHTVPMGQITADDLIVCAGQGSTQVQIAQVPVFRTKREQWNDLITGWIDMVILMPYIAFCQEMLLKKLSGNTPFEAEARVRMLSRDEPYVNLRLPARLECGHSAQLALDEFPQSALSLRISDPGVLSQQGGRLVAGKAGACGVSVVSAEGHVLQKKQVDVYFVSRVTHITLTPDKGNSLLLGDTFTVRADCQPANAVNTAQKTWSVQPSNLLRDLGGGRFTTVAPGTCTIRLTIGNVHQDLTLTVVPAPTDIRLPPEIRMKVCAAPQRVTASLQPGGSACKEIRCSVADGSVAQWNPNTKCVVPIGEGFTTFEVMAIGAAGNVLFTRQCPVTILPAQDIITPPTYLTLGICCAILAAMTRYTAFLPLALIGCLVLFAITAFINLKPWRQQVATRSHKVQAVLAIIGVVGSIIGLIWAGAMGYFSYFIY